MAPAVAQSPPPASPPAAALPPASPRPISWERGWGSAFEEGDRFVAQPRAHAVFRPPWRFRLEASQSFCSKRGWGRTPAISWVRDKLPWSSCSRARACVRLTRGAWHRLEAHHILSVTQQEKHRSHLPTLAYQQAKEAHMTTLQDVHIHTVNRAPNSPSRCPRGSPAGSARQPRTQRRQSCLGALLGTADGSSHVLEVDGGK